MSNNPLALEELVTKVEAYKKSGGVDLSVGEDLSLAVMNLISLEEHFFFTASKTNKAEYFDLSNTIRELRKKLLADLMPNHEGETWCASKHLLSATMRLIEVGNKHHSEGNKDKATDCYHQAYQLYSIFWALKADLATVTETPEGAWSLDTLVSKLADCCKE